MLLVTGGAGFIGSNIVAALNDAGRTDVAVCDVLGHDGKWRNLAKSRKGFLDRFDADYWSQLRPLNAYGWSKNMFDRWVFRAIQDRNTCTW